MQVIEITAYGADDASVNFVENNSVFQENERSQYTHEGKQQMSLDSKSAVGSN